MEISREEIMKKVAVRDPYFALLNIERQEDGITAMIRAEQRMIRGEIGSIGASEASRHLAIAGSVAASLEHNAEGLTYFLARRAEYIGYGRNSSQEYFQIKARCTSLQERQAHSFTVLEDKSKGMISSVAVDFIIIKKGIFERFFIEHRKDLRNNQRSANDEEERSKRRNIYELTKFDGAEVLRRENELIVASYKIQSEYCMGHFPEYPALPIAFCCGHLINLATSLKRLREGRRFFVSRATVDSRVISFAGESVIFKVSYLKEGNEKNSYCYLCQVLDSKSINVRLEMIMTLQEDI